MRPAHVLLSLLISVTACGDNARHAQEVIVREHAPRVRELIRDDLQRGQEGARLAAERMRETFAMEDTAAREVRLREQMEQIRGDRGIEQIVISPVTFMSAVLPDGTLISDSEPRFRFSSQLDVIQQALAGRTGYAVEELAARTEGEPAMDYLLYAAPVRGPSAVMGAVVTAAPLSRVADRLGRQLQNDNASEQGLLVWVYLYRGEHLRHHGTPNDLDTIVPDAEARRAGLERSPGGFTGEIVQFGRWWGYGVTPLVRLGPVRTPGAPPPGPEVGAIIFHSDPM